MENINPEILQQVLENTNDSTAPTINLFPQELITTLTYGVIALSVISALFLLVFIISTIRKWKVQSAILDMHKDIKQIKQGLSTKSGDTTLGDK